MMNTVYFTFRSMTQAQQAVSVLRHSGISAAIIKKPQMISSKGCGYAIRANEQNAFLISRILRIEGTGYEASYSLTSGKVAQEIQL